MRYDLAAFSQVVETMQAQTSKEEAKALYEQLIDQTIPCLDPADGDFISTGDYRNKLYAIVAISFVLSNYFPAYFFPYLYRYKFYQLKHTIEVCGLQLPPMPKANDWRGRCMYYWELCDLFHDFRVKNDWISIELSVFLYHYIPMCLPVSGFSSELDSPTHIWWLGKREAIDEYRNTTLTHLRPSACKGDLVVRYEAAPKQAVTSLWRVLSDVEPDPFDPQYTNCYVGMKQLTPQITIKELQADAYFSKHPLSKRRFLDVDGHQISKEDFDNLLRLLKEKGFDYTL